MLKVKRKMTEQLRQHIEKNHEARKQAKLYHER